MAASEPQTPAPVLRPAHPDWFGATANPEAQEGVAQLPLSGAPRPFQLFSVTGFPCSGMDWVGRLLTLHPSVLVVDSPNRLGPLGGKRAATAIEQRRAADEALRRLLDAAASKPAATHLGAVIVHGDSRCLPGPAIMVMRDGRDVLVHWTLRQLCDRGAALLRFLDPSKRNRMPEIERRFRADPEDVIARNPGLLLSDYDWVRYGAHLWDEQVTGHAGSLGAIEDGRISGPMPAELNFERARSDPHAAFVAIVSALGLDPALAPAFRASGDPVTASETAADLLAEWEVGIWRRYFTPRAGKLFKMDAWQGLEYVTQNYGDDDWVGECQPGPG